MTKQKSLRKIFERIIVCCLNIAGGNVPYFPLQGPNHLQLKFYTIMQDFKRVLDFVKNLVLSNGCEHVRKCDPMGLK